MEGDIGKPKKLILSKMVEEKMGTVRDEVGRMATIRVQMKKCMMKERRLVAD